MGIFCFGNVLIQASCAQAVVIPFGDQLPGEGIERYRDAKQLNTS